VPIRTLIVDDLKPWRSKLRTMLQGRPDLLVIGESPDGLDAVQKAAGLRPDLILLDIGLPELNGIEAAAQISNVSPQSKILFVSQEISADIVQVALALGARGYLSKIDAGRELLTAVDAVLRGDLFVSARTRGEHADRIHSTRATPTTMEIGRHDAGFYSDDCFLLDDLTQFVGAALKAGNSAIIIATESHRDSLLPRLQSHGLDIGAAIEQGRYTALDTRDALSTFMVKDRPDADRFLKVFGDHISVALGHAKGAPRRVAVYGECCGQLVAQGNPEAAVQIEKLGNQLMGMYPVDILCSYSADSFPGKQNSGTFQSICVEHSAIQLR
jgi:DNA-binding NarL/FixJ family response regulator